MGPDNRPKEGGADASGPDRLAARLDADIGSPGEQGRHVRTQIDHGHYDIRIGRNGTWYYRGSEIARKTLVKLFASVLRRDGDGVYWLETPVEKGRIDVDDAPFVAVAVERVAGTRESLRFRTNLDDEVSAGRSHAIRVATSRETGEPAPYIMVRDGLEALISRSVYYELAELAVPRDAASPQSLGVWSDGVFFTFGSLGEPAPESREGS